MLATHKQPALIIRARRAVRAMLAHGQVSEEGLAHHHGLSRRTLIRQLQQ
jgi:hypothetical protein